MRLKAIAAMATNRVIGNQGHIPWQLPEELAWFRSQTLHQALLMGMSTYKSIGKALPNRRTYVLSRQKAFLPDAQVLPNLETVFALKEENLWICGGQQIYEQFLPHCQELFLSIIPKVFKGDAFFPEYERLFTSKECLRETPGFSIFRYWR